MNNILVISEVFYPETFLINNLVLEWKKQGHHIEVLTQFPSYPDSFVFEGYKNSDYEIENWDGIIIHRFRCIEGYKLSKFKKFYNYLYFVFKGQQIGKKIKTKFDHIFVSQTGPLTVAFPAIKSKKKHKCPVTIWTYDIWPDVVYSYGVPKNIITDKILSFLIKRVYKNCDHILVSSKQFDKNIQKYTSKSIDYIPNWIEPIENIKSSVEFEEKIIHFTFTGNISRYQNLENVIEGFYSAEIPNAVLHIFGDGSYKSNIENLLLTKKTNNIILHGRFPQNEMDDIMNKSDVLILSLINNEGIEKTEPLKLQSYLSSGKPILGVLNGVCKEIIEENRIGITTSPDKIDDIAQGFHSIIEFSKRESENIKARSNQLMDTRFNKEKIIQRINRVMQLTETIEKN